MINVQKLQIQNPNDKTQEQHLNSQIYLSFIMISHFAFFSKSYENSNLPRATKIDDFLIKDYNPFSPPNLKFIVKFRNLKNTYISLTYHLS